VAPARRSSSQPRAAAPAPLCTNTRERAQDDEAAFESYFAKEVPVVREKQELVQQIKQANIGSVVCCAIARCSAWVFPRCPGTLCVAGRGWG